MEWYIKVFWKYADFRGRARRKEYWMFYLVNAIIMSALNILEKWLGTFGLLGGLYSLVVLLPAIAVTVRRLHDIGKSGWTVLLGLIPLAGWVWLLALTVADSQPGNNQWGANPKSTSAADQFDNL